ncbi:MAG: ATP-binding cassette domain-containing protein, partial [Treponema sp.]|nr:ATP-binding cassette domain-containing protein [Treponema sp.]
FEYPPSITQGLQTPLLKDISEEGVTLSGGEAQKVAIARALYKNAPFVLLDEPTAALDPESEFDVYFRINKISDAKSVVYISHRLASCRFCSDIIVFDEGRLAQNGSHEELLAQEGGKYRELWNAQAQYYGESAGG